MKALAIARLDVRRLLRVRANLFFLLVLPMLIILLLGAGFGNADARLGVFAPDGRLSAQLIKTLADEPQLTVRSYTTAAGVQRAVERGTDVDAGLAVPAGYDRALTAGRRVTLQYIGRPDTLATQLGSTVRAAVARQSQPLLAAQFVHNRTGMPFAAALRLAGVVGAALPPATVRVTYPNGAALPGGGGKFSVSASTQLVLFIFFTSLTGASGLIETRRLGVARRMLSTPTSLLSVIAGAGLGRLGIAITQALLIVVGALALGVHWGSAPAVAALVLAFCLVGSGAGLLVGSALDNEQQARAVSFLFGLGLAALGGSMVPLEVFPDTMRAIAHTTPHAWANDAFDQLLNHHGTLSDIAGDIAVLLAFAGGLFALATWTLRRRLTA